MLITALTLQHFRSYSEESFALASMTTVILGPNAAGKTNILEAIYLLSSGKSFRAETDREMIAYGAELSRVTGKITSGDAATTSLEVVVTAGQVQGQKAPYKKYLLDGTPKRMVDFIGNLRCVIFWPQDLELITSSPSRRRRYLDHLLCQIDWEYRRTLVSYEKGLRNRNRLLVQIREGEAERSELLFWNQLLIKHGGYLNRKREEFITFINEQKRSIDSARMEVVYDQSIITEARLAQYKDAEVASGTTLVGPHRDDFIVIVKGDKRGKGNERGIEYHERDLHIYGSRGEQRLAVLWLKLTELDYIEKKTSDRPILLLDDIFSELDHEHRALVFQEVPKQQTIMTTTDEHFIEGEMKKGKIITLP